ncbi:AP-1 complex subunit sigma-2 [Lobulomyces angularis]|nr:AP-1 complex subunit sigma-2 [Lobulomyces angularis]
MINWVIIFSRYGKIRLKRWFRPTSEKEKNKSSNEAVSLILQRKNSMCNILEYKEKKLIYKRYASLYFCLCVDEIDNELIGLEIIHRYVQLLDEYFGNVCELDIIYGMQSAYVILDEFLISGEMQESSRSRIMKGIKKMQEVEAAEMLENATSDFLSGCGLVGLYIQVESKKKKYIKDLPKKKKKSSKWIATKLLTVTTTPANLPTIAPASSSVNHAHHHKCDNLEHNHECTKKDHCHDDVCNSDSHCLKTDCGDFDKHAHHHNL